MKLTAFRIQRYKSILDSGWIEVSPLTVLVGKNESGKTTVLRALHKFNPFDPEPYALDREWPRSQRKGRSEDQVVCSTRFALSPEESEEILTLTEGRSLPNELTVTRDYRGVSKSGFPKTCSRRSCILTLWMGSATLCLSLPNRWEMRSGNRCAAATLRREGWLTRAAGRSLPRWQARIYGH